MLALSPSMTDNIIYPHCVIPTTQYQYTLSDCSVQYLPYLIAIALINPAPVQTVGRNSLKPKRDKITPFTNYLAATRS